MRGLLLLNLGTPDAPETGPVRRYLAEFLSDPRVLDMHPVGRWLLLHGIILRTRPARSAHAYKAIWTPEGSPLMVHSVALTRAVQARLGAGWVVELGMRYGNPSIPSALARLRARGATSLMVLPLYPQAAASTTGSSLARVYEVLNAGWDVPPVRALGVFHDDAGFLEAQAEVARPVLAAARADHVLFSFHGLPVRHLKKSDPTGGAHCTMGACCDALSGASRGCYRAQSMATARALAQRLGLRPDGFSVTFQSRLGAGEWVRPYTDEVLPELAKKGVRRLAVLCPAFVSDCLETLEEIGMRGREQFKACGGEELTLVPCVNAHPRFVEAVAGMAERAAG